MTPVQVRRGSVRARGLEPPPRFRDQDLNLARLPVSPRPQSHRRYSVRRLLRYLGPMRRMMPAVAAPPILIATVLVSGCHGGPSHASQNATASSSSTSSRVPPVTSTTTPPTTTSTTSSPAQGCTDRGDSVPLDTALENASGTPGGETVPGSVYYGTCGTTGYAVARFRPSQTATPQEQVSFQDAGSVARYFVLVPGEPWMLAGSQSFPPRAEGCTTFSRLPSALRTAWRNCPQA